MPRKQPFNRNRVSKTLKNRRLRRLESLESRDLLAGDAFEATTDASQLPETVLADFGPAMAIGFDDFGGPFGGMMNFASPIDFGSMGFGAPMFGDFGPAIEVMEGELPEGVTVGEDGELQFADGVEPWEIITIGTEGEVDWPEGDFGFGFADFEAGIEVVNDELPEGFTIGEDGELLDADGNAVEVIDFDLPEGWSEIVEGELPEGVTLGEDGELQFADGVQPWDPLEAIDVGWDLEMLSDFGHGFCSVFEAVEGELPDGFTIGEDGELLDADGNAVEVIDVDLPETELAEGELPPGLSLDDDGNLVFEGDAEGELSNGVVVGEEGELVFPGVDSWEVIMLGPGYVTESGPVIEAVNDLPEGFTISEEGELLDADGNAVEVVDVDLSESELAEGELPPGLSLDDDGNLVFEGELLPDPGFEFPGFEFSLDAWAPVEIAEGELPDGVTIGADGELVFPEGVDPWEGITVGPEHEMELPEGEFDFGFCPVIEAVEGELPEGFTIGEDGELLDAEGNLVEVFDIDNALAETDLPNADATAEPDESQATSRLTATRTTSALVATDLNQDGSTNFSDFLVLSGLFGQEVDAAFADGDLTGDSIVGFDDFLVFAAEFEL